jgi:hypothetical protein
MSLYPYGVFIKVFIYELLGENMAKKKSWLKKVFKELIFELIPSLFQIKIIFPALILAGAVGYIAYGAGFDAGVASVEIPECPEPEPCPEIEPCPECPDILNMTCQEIAMLRPECDFYECPPPTCEQCALLNCSASLE